MTDYVRLGDELTIDWTIIARSKGRKIKRTLEEWPATVTAIISCTKCEVTYIAGDAVDAKKETVEFLPGGETLKDKYDVREWRKVSALPEPKEPMTGASSAQTRPRQTQKTKVMTEQQVEKPKRTRSKARQPASTVRGGANGGGSASAQVTNRGKRVHRTSPKR
jgi:hypothetical protein